MSLLSAQILIINFLVSGLITSMSYLFKRSVRHINPVVLFIVSSVGAFVGSVLAIFIPTVEAMFLQSVLLTIPGAVLSLVFIQLWAKGSKSESYF